MTTALDLRLADGRELEFYEYGDPDGIPLLHLHGAGSCGIEGIAFDAAARTQGVRVIGVNRPGVGRSSERLAMTVVGYAADLRQLVDHLGYDQVAVSGFSNGGMFAMAAASALPDRVRVAVPINSSTPNADSAAFKTLSLFTRLAYRSFRFLPVTYIARSSSRSQQSHVKHGPDKQLMSTAPMRQMWSEINAVPKTLDYLERELRLVRQHWGFDHGGVKQPVEIFNGLSDGGYPYAKVWASELPDARFHEFVGGHPGYTNPAVIARILSSIAPA